MSSYNASRHTALVVGLLIEGTSRLGQPQLAASGLIVFHTGSLYGALLLGSVLCLALCVPIV